MTNSLGVLFSFVFLLFVVLVCLLSFTVRIRDCVVINVIYFYHIYMVNFLSLTVSLNCTGLQTIDILWVKFTLLYPSNGLCLSLPYITIFPVKWFSCVVRIYTYVVCCHVVLHASFLIISIFVSICLGVIWTSKIMGRQLLIILLICLLVIPTLF